MALNQATAHELSARLQQGEITARQLVEAALDRIGEIDGQINAFISVDPEGALARADDIDQRRVAGAALGPLAGIPLALKDVLCVRGGRTTCGSKILEHFIAPTTPRPSSGCAQPTPSSSARPTWTSSPWARPAKTPISAPP